MSVSNVLQAGRAPFTGRPWPAHLFCGLCAQHVYTQNLLIIHRKVWGALGGCAESAWLGSGSSSRLCCFLSAWPWAFPFPSWGLWVSAFLVCQGGQGGEDGWGLSFRSHLPRCYVYTAFLPSSWRERLCLHHRHSHGQGHRGAVVLLGGREGACVSCATLLCTGTWLASRHFILATALWQLALSSVH